MNPRLQSAAAAGTRRQAGDTDRPHGAPDAFRSQSRRRLFRADLLTVLAPSVAGAVALWLADGVLDLSGTIKGYAIRRSGAALRGVGLEDWCLNAGGDVLVSGSPEPGSGVPWQAGIVDPADRRRLATAVPLGGAGRFTALATSGSAERGDHIWTAGAGLADFVQVSVVALDIVTADVLATAIVAGGRPMLDRATDEWEVEVLATLPDGGLLGTPGFRASS